MIAEVTPLARLPRTTSVFDYTVPHELCHGIQIGQGVLISFRNKRTVKGIIIALKNQPFKKGIALKPIKKILPHLSLENWQMNMAHWLKEYYHCSLATAFKILL